MTVVPRLVVLAVLSIVFPLLAVAQTGDTPSRWEPLLQSVQDVLAGRPIGSKAVRIAPDAYVVSGADYASLPSVVSGESKTLSLTEGPSRHTASVATKINDAEDAAYLMLRTTNADQKEERYHTVVFMKDAKGLWVLEAWHTSR